MWAAMGIEALVLFAATGATTAVVRNKLKKTAPAVESPDVAVPAMAE